MEKFKNDIEQEISFTSFTTIETVRNTKTKIQKNLDFGFRILFTTRTGLRDVFRRVRMIREIRNFQPGNFAFRVWT